MNNEIYIQCKYYEICRCEIVPTSFVMEVRSKTAIRKGEEITTRYLGPWEGQPSRQLKIEQNWRFICNCRRCKDPTELGTNFSAIKCPKCIEEEISNNKDTKGNTNMIVNNGTPKNGGYLLPINVQDLGTPWQCNDCGRRKYLSDIECILRKVQTALEKIKSDILASMSNTFTKVVKDIRIAINVLEEKLHPNHYLIFQFKRWIAELDYSNQAPSPFDSITSDASNKSTHEDTVLSKIEFLELQMEYHNDILKLTEALEPGLSVNRAGHIKGIAKRRIELSQMKMSADPNKFTKVQYMAEMKIAMSELMQVKASFKYPENK